MLAFDGLDGSVEPKAGPVQDFTRWTAREWRKGEACWYEEAGSYYKSARSRIYSSPSMHDRANGVSFNQERAHETQMSYMQSLKRLDCKQSLEQASKGLTNVRIRQIRCVTNVMGCTRTSKSSHRACR